MKTLRLTLGLMSLLTVLACTETSLTAPDSLNASPCSVAMGDGVERRCDVPNPEQLPSGSGQ